MIREPPKVTSNNNLFATTTRCPNPPNIRLLGLALYALTDTFAPNLSIWLAGQWTDGLFEWRWVYWQILPLAAIAALLIGWGLPKDPIQTDRFPRANWPGKIGRASCRDRVCQYV